MVSEEISDHSPQSEHESDATHPVFGYLRDRSMVPTPSRWLYYPAMSRDLGLWMILVASVTIAVLSCKERGSIPPPISDGKCLVDQYIGALAKKQTCDYVGYRWSCGLGDDGVHSCVRGAEASGERTPTVPPPPVPIPGG